MWVISLISNPSSTHIKSAPTQFISEELTVSSRPDLASAARVVSGGRALKSKESFDKILDPLADSLGAGMLLLCFPMICIS